MAASFCFSFRVRFHGFFRSENRLFLSRLLGDALDVRGRHVHSDHFDSARALRSEQMKELAQSLGALPFGSPHYATPFMVYHDREELLRTAIIDLVHTDEVQILEQGAVELFGHHALGDLSGRDPADPEVGGRRCLVRVLEKPRHFVLELAREDRAGSTPWNA